MSEAGSDAVRVLRWGLRRYRALVALCLLVGAVLAPLTARQLTEPANAEAQVVAQRLDMDLSTLPRYGEAVFNNGRVAQAVATMVGDRTDIIPDRVSLIADQDSIVFTVVGHDPDPQMAADIANTAAAVFIEDLNAPGVGIGAFALQTPAAVPSRPSDGVDEVLVIPVGVGAGLALGLAIVTVLLVARRPVIDEAAAEAATGVPAVGTVTVPRTPRGRLAEPADFAGLIPTCRKLLRLPTPTIVLVSRRREARMRERLSVAIASVLMRIRDVRFVGPSELRATVEARKTALRQHGGPQDAYPGATPPSVTLVDSSEPLDLVQPPQSTAAVLVVREGMSGAALRAAVVEHLGGSAEVGLLLVKRGRRVRGAPSAHAGTRDGVEPSARVDPAGGAAGRRGPGRRDAPAAGENQR